ncbi:uncharacterized protein [Hyperolius riggenbachi]
MSHDEPGRAEPGRQVPSLETPENSTQQRDVLEMRDRWKAVKDNYKREIEKEKRAKSGSGPAYVSKYCHFQQLEFLRPTFDGRQTEDSFQIDALETESSHTQDGMSQMDTLEAAPSTSQNAPTGRKRSRELVGPGKNVDTNMFYAFQQLMERWKQSQEQMSPFQKLANSLVTYMEKVPEESLPFMHKELLDVIINHLRTHPLPPLNDQRCCS